MARWPSPAARPRRPRRAARQGSAAGDGAPRLAPSATSRRRAATRSRSARRIEVAHGDDRDLRARVGARVKGRDVGRRERAQARVVAEHGAAVAVPGEGRREERVGRDRRGRGRARRSSPSDVGARPLDLGGVEAAAREHRAAARRGARGASGAATTVSKTVSSKLVHAVSGAASASRARAAEHDALGEVGEAALRRLLAPPSRPRSTPAARRRARRGSPRGSP